MAQAYRPTFVVNGHGPAAAEEKVLMTGVQSWWTMVDEVKDEVTDFMAMRSAKDSAAVSDALACKNLGDVLAVQSGWVADAVQDFGAEASRMLALFSKFGSDRYSAALGRVSDPKKPVPGLLFY